MSSACSSVFGFALTCSLAFASSATFGASGGVAPPNPYIDKGACPFECCTYRDWKTTKPVALIDKPYGTKTIATVTAGQVVHGITGVVYSAPVRAVASKSFFAWSNDFRRASIKKGDVFYILHYVGEGGTLIWFKGQTYSGEIEPVGATAEGPPSNGPQWWVNVRTLTGRSGWVLETDQFENQDACG